MKFAYFPTQGVISLMVRMGGHAGLEVGMIGREGMLGIHLALGVATAPTQALVQGAGFALRLPSSAFRAELARSAALQRLIGRYISDLITDLATSSACTRFHQIGPRLARWLLMSHDRADTDTIPVTHEFLSLMLGVRRVGITVAAGALQRGGLIDYRRGQLTVLDRHGLESCACSCYAASRRGYDERLRPG